MDPLAGQKLGPYQLLERLGGGGMGRVYRAVHTGLGHPCAVKVLSAAMATNPTFIARFRREAHLAAELQHPHIIQISDIGCEDGTHYLAMALLEGRSLEQIVTDGGPLDLNRTRAIVRQLAEALDFAHAHGVAHRDIKPSNVMVTPTTQPGRRLSEHVTLIDFGIARVAHGTSLTRNGTFIGTVQYMAPEVAMGTPSGPDSDLYALGILTYELLTGRVPFNGANSQSVMYAQVHEPVPPLRLLRPDLPDAIEAIVLRQLAKQPADRYPTAMAFATALAEATAIQNLVQPPLTRNQESRHLALRQDARPVTVIYTRLVAGPVPDDPDSRSMDRTTLITDSGEILHRLAQGLYEVRGTGELVICCDPLAP